MQAPDACRVLPKSPAAVWQILQDVYAKLADIATVPYKVIEQMTKHPLTDAGIEKFKADYIKVFGE